MKYQTTKPSRYNFIFAAVVGALNAGGAWAQENSNAETNAQQDSEFEQIAVLGSRIKRSVQQSTSTPLTSYGKDDWKLQGLNDTRDLIQTLTINAGSQNNSDNLTQNFTAGTTNINLRGLGVASTLVLLNGRRQVTSSVVTDEGSSFVDTSSLVPALAVERVDFLKDGASAIYGSDAVAGVANFVTRDNFEGAEVKFERRSRTNNGSQDDTMLDLAFGGDVGDDGHVLFAAGYLNRSSLVLGEVDWLQPATSGFGNPATYVLSGDGSVVADPNCEANGGILSGNFCRFDFGPQVTAVPEEKRLQLFSRVSWDVSDSTKLWAEAGFTRNDIEREVSPSFPVLNAPTILASHPDNPFGQDVEMLGRPYGVGKPTERNFYKHSTTRFAIGGEGELNNSTYWDVSFVHGVNDATLNPRDVISSNFQAALHGFGGINCDPSTTAPGTGECLYFNPWSIDDPDNETLRSFIIGDYIGNTKSELTVLEGVISGDELFELPGGYAGFAVGMHYRDETLSATYDSITQQDGFAFLIGNTNFAGERDVWAVFGELLLPVTDDIEVSTALRYEDYGSGVGDTTDPKVSVLWTVTEDFSLRASAGTSFRAPSVHQLQGAQTNFANISDPLNNGESTFGGNRTLGDPNLQPETSTALNFGASFQIDEINFDLDYWSFAFEDVLTRENHQEVVNLDPSNPERVVRTSAGTIAIVNTRFVNANEIETSGFDFNVLAKYDTDYGVFAPSFNSSYVLTYDITGADGVTIDGVGKMNRTNTGNPTPRLRANVGLTWSKDNHNASVFYRYVSDYERNEAANTDEIDSFGQVDVQYRVDLEDLFSKGSNTSLTLGVINAFDEEPPFVAISGSYDPRTGDPRGRRAYVSVGVAF